MEKKIKPPKMKEFISVKMITKKELDENDKKTVQNMKQKKKGVHIKTGDYNIKADVILEDKK